VWFSFLQFITQVAKVYGRTTNFIAKVPCSQVYLRIYLSVIKSYIVNLKRIERFYRILIGTKKAN